MFHKSMAVIRACLDLVRRRTEGTEMFAVYGEAVALLWEVFWDDAGSKSNLQQTGPDTENLVGT